MFIISGGLSVPNVDTMAAQHKSFSRLKTSVIADVIP